MFGENILLTKKNESQIAGWTELPATAHPTYSPNVYSALVNSFEALLDGCRRAFYELVRPFGVSGLAVWGARELGFLPFQGHLGGLRYPLVDVIDAGDYYIVRAEMPGLTKDQVSVFANRNTLQLRAERRQTSEEGVYLYREIAPAVFQRTITFPEEIVPSKIEAVMKDGILEVKILKSGAKIEESMTRVVVH